MAVQKHWLYMGKIVFNEKSCGVVSQCVNLRKGLVILYGGGNVPRWYGGHTLRTLHPFYYYVMRQGFISYQFYFWNCYYRRTITVKGENTPGQEGTAKNCYRLIPLIWATWTNLGPPI